MRDYLRYVRGENGRGIGAVKIIADGDAFGIGVAICNPLDTFSKKEANLICDARLYESFKDSPYTFFEMVDNDWYDDIMSKMPKSLERSDDVGRVINTIFDMIDDIVMDYARLYIKSLKTDNISI